jgi:hypothetical protein
VTATSFALSFTAAKRAIWGRGNGGRLPVGSSAKSWSIPNIVSLPCRLRARSVLEQKGRQGLTLASHITLHGHRLPGPSRAGIRRFRLGVFVVRLYKPHEAIDVRAVGEESDDIALVVDAIDDGPCHAERGTLARTRASNLSKSVPSKRKPCVLPAGPT